MDVKTYFSPNQSPEEFLLIADTYNNCLRKLDVKTKRVEKIETKIDLNEPNSICIDVENRRVYIADTNNHSLKLVEQFDILSTKEIKLNEFKIEFFGDQSIDLAGKLSIDEDGENRCDVYASFKFKLNSSADNSWKAVINNDMENCIRGSFTQKDMCDSVNDGYVYKFDNLRVDRFRNGPINSIQFDFNLVYCESDEKGGSRFCRVFKNKKCFTRNELDKIFENISKNGIILPIEN